MSKGYTYKVNRQKNGEVELVIQVDKNKFNEEKANTFKRMSTEVSLPGFRKGKGPQNLLEAKLGTRLYEETLNRIVPSVSVSILEEENLNPITQLNYTVKKVSEDEGIEYTATFIDFPEFKLGDFSKIKLLEEEVTVSDEELANSIQRLFQINHQQKKDKKEDKKEGKEEKKETDKFEVTDESVKDLGMGLNTVAELQKELKERLLVDKKRAFENKKYGKMIDDAIKASKISVPEALIDQEVKARMADYQKQVEDLGLKLEDFLKSQNTSTEEMEKGWREEVRTRVAQELLFVKISKENNLKVSSLEVESEINAIIDPEMKKEYDNDRGRRYISAVILQQKSALWLREQIEGKKKESK
ncbi:MAG: trigger factor [Candidatus Dojkabacteria bacterium]|nr:MAG: trigger factor [Candidatus Dojkabacteria bacterium]